MPFFSVFAATTQIRLRKYAAHLQPHERAHRKAGPQADVEPPIAVEQRRIAPIQSCALLVRDEHRHTRAILAAIKHLPGFIVSGTELHLRLAKHLTLAVPQVVAKNGCRSSEARERIKSFCIGPLAAKSTHTANSRQLHAANRLALQR